MFNFERVSTPLLKEMELANFSKLHTALPPGFASGQLLLQNLGNREIIVQVASTEVVPDPWQHQNPAIQRMPDNSIRTKLAPFKKVSTLKYVGDSLYEDVNLANPKVLGPEHYNIIDSTEDLNASTIVIKRGAPAGLIPLFFVDQDYQLDQIDTIANRSDAIISLGGQQLDYSELRPSCRMIQDDPKWLTLVLYIEVLLVNGVYSFNETPVSKTEELVINPSSTIQVNWEGLGIDGDNYLPSELIPYTFSLHAPAKPEISCDGAIDYLGILEMPDEVSGTFRDADDELIFENNQEMTNAMKLLGFDVHELTPWVPVDKTVYPRYAVHLAGLGEVPFEENDFFSVELRRPAIGDGIALDVTIAGTVESVMDRCQEYGILFNIVQDYKNLEIGCEPGTPKTEVYVQANIGEFEYTLPDEMDEVWYNPTVRDMIATSFTVDIGWDGLPAFWCFNRVEFEGPDGENAVTVTSNVDTSVTATNITNVTSVDNIGIDYPHCDSTHSPVLCRLLNQIITYVETVNPLVNGYGGQFVDFNQNWVWACAKTDAETGLTKAADYTPIATRRVPMSSAQFGYAIPQPKKYM